MPLTDDQFNELLRKRLEDADDDLENEDKRSAELLSKEEEAELAIMRDALSNYKAESLAWAEKRSATLPSPRPGAIVSLWDRAPRWALVGVAATACAVAAVTFPHSAASGPAIMAVVPTPQVLAADNQLLSSVDTALAHSGSTPTAEELGLSSTDLLTVANDTHTPGSATN